MMSTKQILLTIALAFPFIGGCAKGSTAGDNVALRVLPSEVLIGAAAVKTCQDLATGSTTASGTGPVMLFPKVTLAWNDKSNNLYLSTIRVTVTGFGITGGKYVYEASADEMQALLGATIFTAGQFTDSTHTTETDALGIKRGTPACGLVVSGVTLTDGKDTASFKARVQIDVIGTSMSTDYTDQQFVKQTVYATADYTKY